MAGRRVQLADGRSELPTGAATIKAAGGETAKAATAETYARLAQCGVSFGKRRRCRVISAKMR
jgi:hypothetical protein